MTQIKKVALSAIDPNPHRMLETYMWVEAKVKALKHSIEDIGMWESIIARPHGERYQLAFGHHRLEAARRAGLTEIPVIVKNLTDEEMLKYMGRENGEDYSTDFLIMLNTWEGAVEFFHCREKKCQAVDIARLLGWTRVSGEYDVMSPVAEACANAHDLITGGYMARSDFEGISVSTARDIVSRTSARMAAMQKAGEAKQLPQKEIEKGKEMMAVGAKVTASKVRHGEIPTRDVRSSVEVEAYKAASSSKVKASPLFALFINNLTDQISKMLDSDSSATKLAEIEKSIHLVTMDEDIAGVKRLDFYLGELSTRAEKWRVRIAHNKVVPLKGVK